jgi:murein DD-endopeptidase MepM/ murein hydrolase activator NlpD
MKKTVLYFLMFCLVIVTSLSLRSFVVSAQSIDELEQQIQDKATEREDLEEQAQRIRIELTQVGAEKGSLTRELNRINAEKKDLENTISKTQNEISLLDLTINKNSQEITRYTSDIVSYSETIAALLRGINQYNNLTVLEIISSRGQLSDIFQLRDGYTQLQKPLIQITNDLNKKKISLRETSYELEIQQYELSEEKEILDDQRSIVELQEDEKNKVLDATEEKESTAQRNLISTLATISALDKEIRDFESKLEFALNPSSIPQRGSAVFDWPLDQVLITQRFGRTVSSERLYVSGSHSGMDFRAAVGTPVYAVADGIVKGVGNTDDQCFRASFGRWIFIDHDIGLSTTSAHLSSFKVKEGQRVRKGDVIGYSGNTGRSTAPHLHLTVYATKGVDGGQGARITNRPSSACPGTDYRMPLAPTAAYLDPIDFLPPTNLSNFKHASLAN